MTLTRTHPDGSPVEASDDLRWAQHQLKAAQRRVEQRPNDPKAIRELKAALTEVSYVMSPWLRPGKGEPREDDSRSPRGNAARYVKDPTPGPWKSWNKRMSRHGRAIKFIETYVRAPKGKGHGQPMKLAGFQKEQLEQDLAEGVDASATSFPRGNGKSTFGAAFGVWGTFDDDDTGSPQVPVVATTVGQAIRSCYGVGAAMVAASPELRDRAVIYTGIATPRIYVPFNGGEMFPISNALDGLQGLDPTIALCDEIGFQPMEVWEALLLAGGKRERSLTMGFGTPGLTRTNALWRLREMVTEGGPRPGFNYREYAADPGCRIDDRAQWRKANPALRAGFLRVSALETALGLAQGGVEAAFRIFRLGQWVEGYESWLGNDGRYVWDSGEDRTYQLVPAAPTWVGIDAARTRDTTAVVAGQWRTDDEKKLHAKARIWVPTKDEPTDMREVMAHVRSLHDRFKLQAVAYDPKFMDWPAAQLLAEGIPMVEIPQSVERMTPIIGDLYTFIRERNLTHERDALYAQQVMNAVAKLNERGFTLSKGKSRGHIDAAVATGLMLSQARIPMKKSYPAAVY